MNFSNFLQNLASGGEGLDLTEMIKRKPNAPPTQALLPSESAITDVAHGASEAMIGGSKEGGGESGGMATIGMGALKGLSDYSQKEQPPQIQPMQMYGNPIRDNAIAKTMMPMRGLRYGGIVQDGETVIVGEDGQETVTKTPDGQVVVNPTETPMPNGIDQTIGGGRGGGISAAPAPSVNPNGSAQQDPLNELYSQVIQNSQQKPNAWKDFGFGALQGLNNFLNNSNAPIQSYNDVRIARKNAPILSQIRAIEGQRGEQRKAEYEVARTKEIFNKNEDRDLDRQFRYDKLEIDKEYKGNLVTLGKQKADDVKVYREAIIDLKNQGVRQGDERIKALNKRIDETIRHNQATESQQKINEEGRNSRNTELITGRKEIAAAQIGSQMQRQQISIQAQKTLKEMELASKSGNLERAAQLKADLAKLKAQYDQFGVEQ